MPLPWSTELAGRIEEHVISSDLLRGNPLGDPYERPLLVYTPPGYDDAPDRRYPSVYVIQGYTGHVAMWRGRSPFRQPFPETADAMFARAEAPPAIVAYVDAWTAYCGSQFVDSPGTGTTTPTCATKWSLGWTPGTGRSPMRHTGRSRASRAAASAR
ncbi:hypothetical protein [Trebonia kvetii]|uniref:hypothetical protein n=1 Tax=Trebonia kvetii TaxID=2480626 RepID=UPI001FECF33F|nr:hypothetical protein [Trebonia kvetii]